MAKGKRLENTEPEKPGKIVAKVSDYKYGLRVYDHVQLIRIKSSDFTLLIMEDHFPTLGAVHGDVELVTPDNVISLSGVDGFYLHRNNEFSLLISRESEAEREGFRAATEEEAPQDAATDN